MLPIRHSTIFKSRWWALAWAAGILWSAIEFAGGAGDGGNAADNAAAPAADPQAAQVAAIMNSFG